MNNKTKNSTRRQTHSSCSIQPEDRLILAAQFNQRTDSFELLNSTSQFSQKTLIRAAQFNQRTDSFELLDSTRRQTHSSCSIQPEDRLIRAAQFNQSIQPEDTHSSCSIQPEDRLIRAARFNQKTDSFELLNSTRGQTHSSCSMSDHDSFDGKHNLLYTSSLSRSIHFT